LRLLQSESREVSIVKGAFRHHPVHCTPHLLPYLGDGQFRHIGIATPGTR
jgi:hypothetical protein